MTIRIVKAPIKKLEIFEVANQVFGDIVKAVVDVEQEIMAIGGELHADEEILLTEQEGSKRGNTWGINLYPQKPADDWIEFDSLINLKPAFGNRSRDVENPVIKDKIRSVVKKLVVD